MPTTAQQPGVVAFCSCCWPTTSLHPAHFVVCVCSLLLLLQGLSVQVWRKYEDFIKELSGAWVFFWGGG
jgi:hypothetical protein